jgi:hypothetical protein
MALPHRITVHEILKQQFEITSRGRGADGSGEPLLGPTFAAGDWMEVVPVHVWERAGASTECAMGIWVRDAVLTRQTPAQWGGGRPLLEVRLQGVWARALATLRRRPNLRLEDMVFVMKRYRMEAMPLNDRVVLTYADEDRDATIEMVRMSGFTGQ